MIGPLMFGFFMDHGAPRWVFGASVVVMIAVALVALVGDRCSARCRRFAAAEYAAAEYRPSGPSYWSGCRSSRSTA